MAIVPGPPSAVIGTCVPSFFRKRNTIVSASAVSSQPYCTCSPKRVGLAHALDRLEHKAARGDESCRPRRAGLSFDVARLRIAVARREFNFGSRGSELHAVDHRSANSNRSRLSSTAKDARIELLAIRFSGEFHVDWPASDASLLRIDDFAWTYLVAGRDSPPQAIGVTAATSFSMR